MVSKSSRTLVSLKSIHNNSSISNSSVFYADVALYRKITRLTADLRGKPQWRSPKDSNLGTCDVAYDGRCSPGNLLEQVHSKDRHKLLTHSANNDLSRVVGFGETASILGTFQRGRHG